MLDFFGKSDDKAVQRAENYFWKAMELLNADKHDLAAKELQSAITIEAERVLTLLEEQFNEYYAEGRTLEALTMGKVLIKHRANDFRIMNRMGNIYRKIGDPKAANEYYKRAIGLNKSDDTALLNLAAGMAKVPRFDEPLRKLLQTYIRYNEYLIPQSTYPRDPNIISHLTEMLNMKQFFGKVERLQEVILKKALMQENQDFDKLDVMMERIKEKVNARIQHEKKHPNVLKLLQEAMNLDWQTLPAGDKDYFLWNILNLGLYVFRKNSKLDKNNRIALDSSFQTKDLQLAIDTFVRLKVEGYSYRYLDMIIALSHTFSGDFKQAIDGLKALIKNDPQDRFLNINLGLLYHQEGNRLLSLVYLLKGAYILSELGGACYLTDIIEKAKSYHQKDEQKKALKLYQIAALETDSIDILTQIGEILISLHRYYEAIQPFRAILRLDPKSILARKKLEEIQEHFVFLANEFYDVGEYIKASEHFEKALEIEPSAALLKKAMKAYKMQGDHKKEFELQDVYRRAQAQEKAQEQEAMRQKEVTAGLKHMKSGNFQKAIDHFREAFRMRMDKDVFMYLTYLYKKFNHKKALQDLVTQWNAMIPKDGGD